jgi:hypothetical protein
MIYAFGVQIEKGKMPSPVVFGTVCSVLLVYPLFGSFVDVEDRKMFGGNCIQQKQLGGGK